jgi:heme A synthase
MNKFAHGGTHFESPHAILGLITYILLLIQAFVGITQYFLPQLYGGVDNAKKIYKYHRVGGYVLFTLMLVTVVAATRTTYNLTTLHIQTWAVVVASVLALAGILPRVKKQKLGL